MKNQLQKGNSNFAGIAIIVFIIIIMISGAGDRSNLRNENYSGEGTHTIGFSGLSNNSSISDRDSGGTRSNKGTGTVTIGPGNAAHSYQSYEEYITLDNTTRAPINITGWQLRNGKDKRPYYTGSNLQRFSADVAIIPQATLVLLPTGNSINQDVVLANDEKAIITTGSFGNRSPYPVTSFKETMCTGYLEALPDYAFTPALSRNCPDPEKEPGFANLPTDCKKIVERLNSCDTPKIGERVNREYCADCYKGQLVSSTCKAYLEEHFSYRGCLIYHQGDPGFFRKTWRIFLGRGWEMWAKEYESIELFDRLGQLINFRDY